MKILHLLFHSVIVLLIVFSCHLLFGFVQDIEETKATIGNEAPRLTSFFDIGEKSVGKEAKQGIKSLDNFDTINAFSILDVKLKLGKHIIPKIKERGFNVLLVAELRKKGEETWNRIDLPPNIVTPAK